MDSSPQWAKAAPARRKHCCKELRCGTSAGCGGARQAAVVIWARIFEISCLCASNVSRQDAVASFHCTRRSPYTAKSLEALHWLQSVVHAIISSLYASYVASVYVPGSSTPHAKSSCAHTARGVQRTSHKSAVCNCKSAIISAQVAPRSGTPPHFIALTTPRINCSCRFSRAASCTHLSALTAPYVRLCLCASAQYELHGC